MSLPCSQPGQFGRLLVQTLRNGKCAKRAFWNFQKLTIFRTCSTFSIWWAYLAASQGQFEGYLYYLYTPSETGKLPNRSSETVLKPTIFAIFFFHFFNPMSLPCSQPGQFEGYWYKASETGKVPNGPSETVLKPTIFPTFSTFSTRWAYLAASPRQFEGYLYKPSERGKVPKRAFWNVTKIYHFRDFFPLFQPDEPTLQPARRQIPFFCRTHVAGYF